MTEKPRRAVLAGTGSYLPEQIVTNAQMAERVETSDEWIVERTGIRQRHFSAPHETAAYMGAAAARRAVEQAGMAPEDIDAIIVATSTPIRRFRPPPCIFRPLSAPGAPSASISPPPARGSFTGFRWPMR